MLLPAGYQTVQDYFEEIIQFLYEYHWVYRYPLTKLLVHGVLDYIPNEWRIVLQDMSSDELTLLSSANSKEHWPQSLSQYLQKCQSLQFKKRCIVGDWNLSPKLQKGLSRKKQHEVSRLASLIHEECIHFPIKRILDIGSGLGSLDFILHIELGYNVLGIESKSSLVSSASQKAFSFCNSCEGISFLQYEIKNSVDRELVEILQKRLFKVKLECTCNQLQKEQKEEENVQETATNATCLVGLHPCGDLSAASANLFLRVPEIKMMILVPCCYHKMEILEAPKEEDHTLPQDFFSHFPLSQSLTTTLQEKLTGYEEYLARPFLRLAAQESSLRWQNWTELQHKQRSENLMSRATFDLACHRLGIKLRKKHRRCVRKCQRNNFDAFLEDVVERYDFVLPNGTITGTEEVVRKTKDLWIQYKKFCGLAEAFTGLQAAMQACVETFILVDKMVYMLEQQGHQLSFDIVKIMDEDISPRCHGLIVRKLKESTVT